MKTIHKAMAVAMTLTIAVAILSGCSGQKAKAEDLPKTTVNSFSSIRLTVDVAAVDIIPSADEFAIEYHIVNQDVSYGVKDGMLTLNTTGNKKTGVNNTEHSYAKIYVPDGSSFTTIDYKGDVGDLHVEKIVVDDMTINTDVGNVTLSDVSVNHSLNVGIDVGNAEVALANTDCSYNISVDVGKIAINGAEFSGVEIEKCYSSVQGPQVNLALDTGNLSFICK